MSTTAFSLPAFEFTVFAGGVPGLSRKRLPEFGLARALHVAVLAFDSPLLGRFPKDEEIGREPNAVQLSILERLRSSLAVCGIVRDSFPIAPGRSCSLSVSCLLRLEASVFSCSDFKDPYVRAADPAEFHEDPSLLPLEEFPLHIPHRDLDASRLRITGRVSWTLEDYLHDLLWLLYVMSGFSRHGLDLECLAAPSALGCLGQVFQFYKSGEHDRQLGDRRIPNSCESQFGRGPSRHPSTGQTLMQLTVERSSEQLLGSVSDRRDFYHQCKVFPDGAKTSIVPFSFSETELAGTDAPTSFEQVLREKGERRKERRLDVGDELGREKTLESGLGSYPPCFASLFQGDHLKVVFARFGHGVLVKDESLPLPDEQLFGHAVVPFGSRWTGLSFYDFLAIGAHSACSPKTDSFAFKAPEKAGFACAKLKLEGFAERDVRAANHSKAAYAEIDSRVSIVRNGMSFGARLDAKSFALLALSLRAVSLPIITPHLAACSSGSRVSVMLYRRRGSSSADEFFGPGFGFGEEDYLAFVPLPRVAPQEFVLLTALVPFMTCHAAADCFGNVHVSGAPNGAGAVGSSTVSSDVAAAVWQSSDKEDRYVMSESPGRAVSKSLVEELESPVETCLDRGGDDENRFGGTIGIENPPMLIFDFVGICGGVGAVTRAASELDMVVESVRDLGESRHHDLRGLRFLEWAEHMAKTGRFASSLVEPPCTGFNAVAHPAVGSCEEPLGCCRTEERTLQEDILDFRSFVLVKVGIRKSRPCGLEQPHLSKLAWTVFLQTLFTARFCESCDAPCQFGSFHEGVLCSLLYLLECLGARCLGGHPHLRVEGKWTEGSAVYVFGSAMSFAKCFHRVLLCQRRAEVSEIVCEGFEGLVNNDLMSFAEWNFEKSWKWRGKSYVNVLEEHSTVAALGIVGLRDSDSRHCPVVDSIVSWGALAKGSSSTDSFQLGFKWARALQVVFGLFPFWTFSPTRLVVADDPTRQRELRKHAGMSLSVFWDREAIAGVHSNGLRRFAAYWCRLAILMPQGVPAQAWVVGCLFDFWIFNLLQVKSLCGDGGSVLLGCQWTFPISIGLFLNVVTCIGGFALWSFLVGSAGRAPLRFRSPVVAKPLGICRLLLGVLLVLGSKLSSPLNFWVLGSGFLVSWAAAMEPENPAGRKRAALHALLSLPADIVMRKRTNFGNTS